MIRARGLVWLLVAALFLAATLAFADQPAVIHGVSAMPGDTKVPAAFTSQDCSVCGARVRKPLAHREHRCGECGYVAQRDHNAARNIKKKGG